MNRREVLQLLALMGVSPLALPACDDEADTPAGTPDAGTMDPDAEAPVEEAWNPEPPPEYVWDGPAGPESLFQHGVASGDPWPESVVIWTRVTTEEAGPIEVWWEMALDPAFTQRVAGGSAVTSAARDWTVKVEAGGLRPGRVLYYRFFYQGRQSLVGRTRTAPAGAVDHLRFAVVSCSNFPNGYFHVYRRLAEQADLELVLHLGDYIYEYGSSGEGERAHQPTNEIVSLQDYRTRYAQYRRDTDLMAAHQQHPWVVVWDDHETTNNSWQGGAQNHQPETEGPWEDRLAAATQAWFEWMPVRDTPDQRIWRRLQWGDLMDLFMLDTRIWGREEQAAFGDFRRINAPGRQLLGEDQEDWLLEGLCTSDTRWRVLGQQVMIAPLLLGANPLNSDQWDGYPDARLRLQNALRDCGQDNLIVLTGDIHTSWASDVVQDVEAYNVDTGEGAFAVEFVTPSVTSGSLSGIPEATLEQLLEINPHIRFTDLTQRGYVVVDMTPERTQGAWFLLDRVDRREFEESFATAYRVVPGRPTLRPDPTPAPPRPDAPAPAPGMPGRPWE
jgi:alkaline phosphatase D